MRATAFGVLLLMVAACGSEAATPQPVGTTTLTPATTIAAPTQAVTTTPGAGECEGADRGVLCPPDLPVIDFDSSPSFFAPGTYRTRVFSPHLEFTQDSQFQSLGETTGFVMMGQRGCPDRGCLLLGISANTPPNGIDLERVTVRERGVQACIASSSITESTVFGLDSTRLDIIAQPSTDGSCVFVFPHEPPLWIFDGGRLQVHEVDLGGEIPHLVLIQGLASNFDQWLDENVQPVLDSVRFLDGS